MSHAFISCCLLVAVLFAAGCPGPEDSKRIGQCTALNEQCRLREGLLGVCNRKPCPDGQEGPCLECISQH